MEKGWLPEGNGGAGLGEHSGAVVVDGGGGGHSERSKTGGFLFYDMRLTN